jgi:glycosyltransferase involved in cell wall biosynthesis
VALKTGCIVIYEKRIGYGSACLAGIEYLHSLKIPPKFVCFFDGDGQSSTDDIIKVARPVLPGKISFSQGSRTIFSSSSQALTPLARFGNNFFSILLTILWGQRITDLGPLRVIRWDTLSNLKMSALGYGWTIEMTAKLLKQGTVYLEIPVSYKKRFTGKSKISGNLTTAIRAAFVMMFTLIQVAFFWRPVSAE